MNKVTIIHLNGTTYHVEEDGYTQLSEYLARAAAKLADNPDKDEIMRDFEQAIAERFQTYLTAAKNVVTAQEVKATIEAMGPVEGEAAAESTDDATREPGAGRRLFHVRQGSYLLGVCMGIATYFDVDVALIRILFVLLAIVTSGGAIAGYILIAIFTPRADTVAAARAGRAAPFNAQKFMNAAEAAQQARQKYAQFTDKREWKEWKRTMKRSAKYYSPSDMSGGLYMLPALSLARLLVFVVFIAAVADLIGKHALFGHALPAGIPLWAALIAVFAVWQFVSFPLRMMKWQAFSMNMPGHTMPQWNGMNAFWHTLSSILWLCFVVGAGWIAYQHIPAVHDLFVHVGTSVQQSLQDNG
jgi:phage shock protein PspC (stress-responsive transcriptional regulator)